MNGIVCDSQVKAQSCSDFVDGKLGYPLDGIDIGNGLHATAAESRTLRYALVIKHPTLLEWAYPQDSKVAAQAVPLPIGATVQLLDATWFPVPVTI